VTAPTQELEELFFVPTAVRFSKRTHTERAALTFFTREGVEVNLYLTKDVETDLRWELQSNKYRLGE